jgi:hypothetical protein
VVDDPELYVIPPRGQSIQNLTRRGNDGVAARNRNQESRTAFGKLNDVFR